MIKIRYTDKKTSSVLAKRRDKKPDKACIKQETFVESCFKGDVPEEDAKDPKKPPIKVVVPGEKEPSPIVPAKDSKIDDKPVTIKLDLGGNVWIIARLEGETLTMIKIRYTDKKTSSVLAK